MDFSSNVTIKGDKFFYVLFKLISDEGFSRNEMIKVFETSKNIPTRYLNAIRNSIYDYFGNDIAIVYNFKNKTFHLVCYRGSPNIINFFNSFKNVKE